MESFKFGKIIILFLITYLILSSCASTKKDRIVKRQSKIIRETGVIIYAEKQTVVSNIRLMIREHHVFDLFQSGVFWEYYSGTWSYRSDTLFLDYFKNHKPIFSSNYALVDTIDKKIVLKFEINNKLVDVVLGYKGGFK